VNGMSQYSHNGFGNSYLRRRTASFVANGKVAQLSWGSMACGFRIIRRKKRLTKYEIDERRHKERVRRRKQIARKLKERKQ
jgi:hypothetical protein